MEYQRFLVLLLLFIFTAFLYPELDAAVAGVSVSDPLYPFISRIGLIFLGSEVVAMGYVVIDEN